MCCSDKAWLWRSSSCQMCGSTQQMLGAHILLVRKLLAAMRPQSLLWAKQPK